MSEIIALHYCRACKKVAMYMFSGSRSKGTCLDCGFQSDEDLDWKKDRVISANI